MRNRFGEVLIPSKYLKPKITPDNNVRTYWPERKARARVTSEVHKDIYLIQVPNLRESGYYAGVSALKAYFKQYQSELRVLCADPIMPFFEKNNELIHSNFGIDFNTFAHQGDFMRLGKYPEMKNVCDIVCDEITRHNPFYVGFSIIDGNIDATLYIAKYIKKQFPNINIIFGGKGVDVIRGGVMPGRKGGWEKSDNLKGKITNTSTYIYDFKKWDFVDYIIFGDGEVPFHKIIGQENKKNLHTKVPGLVYQYNNKWYGSREHQHHIDKTYSTQVKYFRMKHKRGELDIPTPDYSDFVDTPHYQKSYAQTVPIIMSRGCPFKCSFCSIPTVVPQFNHRRVDSIVEELEQWYNRGHKSFFIHDSIINFNSVWLKELCEKIIAKKWEHLTWGGNMRLIKPMRDIDNMRLYSKAGFHTMITGMESASPKVLRHMKKYSSIQGMRDIFDNIREINNDPKTEYPIRILLQLIIGYINESEEDFQMTLDFVEEYSDIIYEVTTCSLFLCWYPLVDRWKKEGNSINFKNEVEWETEFSTLEQRLERGKRIEKLFKKLGLKYNLYLREVISGDASHSSIVEGENKIDKKILTEIINERT